MCFDQKAFGLLFGGILVLVQASQINNLPANSGDSGSIPGLESKEMATYSSILAWRIPWTEKSAGLQSTGLKQVGHD